MSKEIEIEILRNNLVYLHAVIKGQKVEFQEIPELGWRSFDFGVNTLDIFSRCRNFRFKDE